MSTNQSDIGLIGLAVMGENLVLNMESKGFSVAAFNRTFEVTEKFTAGRAKGKTITPTRTMDDGGVRRCIETPTQSDDHGEGGRAGRFCHQSTCAANGTRGRHY